MDQRLYSFVSHHPPLGETRPVAFTERTGFRGARARQSGQRMSAQLPDESVSILEGVEIKGSEENGAGVQRWGIAHEGSEDEVEGT